MAQGKVEFIVTMNSNDATNKTQKLKKELDGAGKSSATVEANLSKIGLIKLAAVTTGTRILVNTMTKAATEASQMSYEFARVNMLTSANAEEAKILEKQMIRLGSETTLTTTEIAQAAQELGSLGFNAKDASEALDAVVKAAEGTGETAQTVAKSMAAIEKQFGLTADQSQRIADILVVGANDSAASVEYMGEAFKYVGKDAANLGMSVEETAAIVMTLADNGLVASQSGTGLRAVIKNLTAPTKETASALESLGVEAYDSQGNFKGFTPLVDDLSKAFEGLSDEEKNHYARAIAGKTASAAFLTVIEEGPDSIAKYTAALEESGGAAEAASQKLRDTLGAQLNSVYGSITALVYAFLSLLEPAIIIIMQAITTLLGYVTNAVLEFSYWIKESTLVTAVMGILKDNLNIVAIVLGIVTVGFGLYKLAMSLATAEQWKKIASTIAESVQEAILAVKLAVTNTFKAIGTMLTTLFTAATWKNVGAKIADNFQTATSIIKTAASNIQQAIANGLKAIFNIETWKNVAAKIADNVQTRFSALLKSIENLQTKFSIFLMSLESGQLNVKIKQQIKEIFIKIQQIALQITLNIVTFAVIIVIIAVVAAIIYIIATQTDWQAIMQKIIEVLRKMYDYFVANILPVLIQFANFIKTQVIPWLVNFVKTIAANLMPIIQKLFQILSAVLIPVFKVLASFVQGFVIPALKLMGNIIQNVLMPVISIIANVIKIYFIANLKILNAILGVILPPIKALANLIGKALVGAMNAIKPLFDWFLGILQNISEFLGNVTSGIGGFIDSIASLLSGDATVTVRGEGAAIPSAAMPNYRAMSGFGVMQNAYGTYNTKNDNSNYNDNRSLYVTVESMEEAKEVIGDHSDWWEVMKG